MMRAIAALLIAGAAGLGLTGCNSVTGGHAVSTDSNSSASTGSDSSGGDISAPNGKTLNLDNVTDGTMDPREDGTCSRTDLQEMADCVENRLADLTVTVHATVSMTIAGQADGYVILALARPGIDDFYAVNCPVDLAGCTSVQEGDQVYVVATYRMAKVFDYMETMEPVVESITRQ